MDNFERGKTLHYLFGNDMSTYQFCPSCNVATRDTGMIYSGIGPTGHAMGWECRTCDKCGVEWTFVGGHHMGNTVPKSD